MTAIQSRKSFFKTIGTIGAGSLLSTYLPAKSQPFGIPAAGKPLRVAHLTDIHVSPGRIPEAGMANALHAVNNLEEKADFIINGGDAIMNAASLSLHHVNQQWKVFHDIMKADNSLPVYHCIGNHDIFSWALPDSSHRQEKREALSQYQLKNPYYSFSQKGWHFIILDSIHGRKSIPGYFGKIDAEQLTWLENELDTVIDKHICIVSHIPILAICMLFDSSSNANNKWNVPDNALHADADKLIELFYRHKNVKACLSGHIHLIDHVNYLGIDYYCNGAVSGSWWKGNYKQFAPSFSVINFEADGTTSRENHFYNWKTI